MERHYLYDGEAPTLFKPTLASDKQFRLDRASALSYFIGGNPAIPEDTGFALKGWTGIRWERAGMSTAGDLAVTMGNYFLVDATGGELKVEFSFVYRRLDDGGIRIVLHDSHLPYISEPKPA